MRREGVIFVHTQLSGLIYERVTNIYDLNLTLLKES